MSETVLASPRKSELLEIVKTLSDVTRKLSEIVRTLAMQTGENPLDVEALTGSLVKSERALAQAFEHLSVHQVPPLLRPSEEEAHKVYKVEETHGELRKEILVELLRNGRALPLERAAALLTFVEDIQPVLMELEREELIRIRQVAGADVIELTPRGRDAARRLEAHR